jgi:hypothetical protein
MSAGLCFITNYALDDVQISKVDAVVDKLNRPGNPTFYGPVTQLLLFFFMQFIFGLYIVVFIFVLSRVNSCGYWKLRVSERQGVT